LEITAKSEGEKGGREWKSRTISLEKAGVRKDRKRGSDGRERGSGGTLGSEKAKRKKKSFQNLKRKGCGGVG